jgi:type IV pilus assembly protein PilA
MKNLKFRHNNKGFSLVELIIVIAIMAALIAIIAPQYLKYVEKSRVQADETTAAEILSATKVAASDPAVNLLAGDYKVAWNGGSSVTVTAPSDDDGTFSTAVTGAIGATPAIKSTTHKSQTYTVTVTVAGTGVTVNAAWA